MLTEKETQCDSCNHQNVCALKERFAKLRDIFEDLVVRFSDGSTYKLPDVPFIAPIHLKCKEYQPKVTTRSRCQSDPTSLESNNC